MPKEKWIKYLVGEADIQELPPKSRAITYLRIRKRAQKLMKLLTLIAENIENITEKPEKQFNLIFDDQTAVTLLRTVSIAWWKGRLYRHRARIRDIAHLEAALTYAKIEYNPEKLARDRNYRIAISEKLIRKQNRIGKRLYFGPITIEPWERCPNCGKELTFVKCPNCEAFLEVERDSLSPLDEKTSPKV